MKPYTAWCLLSLAGIGSAAVAAETSSAEHYWPQWRGPLATGVAPQADPPVEWSETKNVRWKVEAPGLGHATPIIWGDRVYIQTAEEIDGSTSEKKPADGSSEQGGGRRRGPGNVTPDRAMRFVVLALDRKTGRTVWQTTVAEEKPHEGRHPDGSFASASPVTDGEHIFAHFGSRGLHCLDMQGRIVWSRDLGDMQTRRGFGEGSSPALFGDTVVVTWDHEGPSFITALNKQTGKTRWKVDRDEVTSWATPLVVPAPTGPQVVASATNRVRGYDLADGRLIWECGGQTPNTIPSPVFADGIVYAMSGFRGNAVRAIRVADATGDVTDSAAVVWRYDQDTPYVPSPMLQGDLLYFVKSNKGILSCLDVRTGKPVYEPKRLDDIEGVYASPVGAKDRVYVAGRNGTTTVLKSGPEFKVLATNNLDEDFVASPAVAGGEIYLRGHRFLYCIARD